MSSYKKTFRINVIILVWALVSLFGRQAGAEIIDRVVAVVDTEVITSSELEQEARLRFGQKQGTPSPEAYQQLLSAIIEQKLIVREAAAAQIVVKDQDVDRALKRIEKQNGVTLEELKAAVEAEGLPWEHYVTQVRNDLLRTQVIGMKVHSQVNVTEKDYAEYYEAHVDKYVKPAAVRIEQLLFPVPEEAGAQVRAEALTQAKEARARLQAGEDFRTVGEALGVVKTGEPVDLGYFGKGELMGALDEAAFSLPAGAVSDVLETDHGFAIIRVLDRKEEQSQTLEEIKGEIHDELYRQKAERKYKEWMDGLIADVYIETKL